MNRIIRLNRESVGHFMTGIAIALLEMDDLPADQRTSAWLLDRISEFEKGSLEHLSEIDGESFETLVDTLKKSVRKLQSS